MEIFKLLSRSTNLQKSTPASKKISNQHVPSAGVSGQGASTMDVESPPSIDSLRLSKGTKRKRVNEVKEQGLALSEQLNFFSSGAQESSSTLTHTATIAATSFRDKKSEQKPEIPAVKTPNLREDECRRILKQKKIKVILLDGEQALEDGQRKRQKDVAERTASKKNAHTQLSPQPLTSFNMLRNKYGISRRLAENLDDQGYIHPTEVQLGSLPILLGSDKDRGLVVRVGTGRKKQERSQVDLLTVAPTGSGKTLAFMISVIQALLKERHGSKTTASEKYNHHQIQALIIAPTHELADQIVNEGLKLASGTGVKIAGMRKGMKLLPELQSEKEEQNRESTDALSGGNGSCGRLPVSGHLLKTDILVSTPLMLLHAISPDAALGPRQLTTVRYLVLDEADILLDPLFRTQTLGIWTACTNPSLQVSLWSATIGSSIESLARSFILERQRKVTLSDSLDASPHHIIRVMVGLKDSAIPNVSHRLVYAATEQGKLLALRQLLHPSTASADGGPSLQPPFLIFTQTIPRAIALHSELFYDISPEAGGSSRIAVLHSDLSDTARSAIMAGFRKGEIWVLITTDLLSRGVDFRGLNGVVNYDIPNTGAAYVHRVGRTGRQGREGGLAVTIYTKEDIPYVKNIANVIAASEKISGKTNVSGKVEGMQRWLLDVLPSVSKRSRKELKLKGVEGRRAVPEGQDGGKDARRMRISTKSGYDRKLENRRKGAMTGSQRRLVQETSDPSKSDENDDNDEWGGIED